MTVRLLNLIPGRTGIPLAPVAPNGMPGGGRFAAIDPASNFIDATNEGDAQLCASNSCVRLWPSGPTSARWPTPVGGALHFDTSISVLCVYDAVGLNWRNTVTGAAV